MSLLDLCRLAEEAIKAGDVTPVLLFPIGRWKSNKYAQRYPSGLPLTAETAETMVSNFEANTLGIDVQFSIAGVHNVPAAAAFWVQSLTIAPYDWQGHSGDAVWCEARWTQAGADAVNNDEFRYVSIEAGDFITPTGETVPWVLQGGVLTNYPVIKIMPPVKQAALAIAAGDEARQPLVEISLRDVLTLAEDSYDDLRKALESALGERYGEHVWVADFGDDWVVYEESPLDGPFTIWRASYVLDTTGFTFGTAQEVERQTTYVPKPQPAAGYQAAESSPSAIAELLGNGAVVVAGGLNPVKEQEMSKLTELLKLSEGAAESVVLAEVQRMQVSLAEVTAERDTEKSRADTAVAKLAEGEKTERTRRLEAAIAATEVLPKDKDRLLALAEKYPDAFDEELAARKGEKHLELGERGSGTAPDEPEYDDPSVELAEKAAARAKKDGIEEEAALALVLAEDPALKNRYVEFSTGGKLKEVSA